MHICFIVDNSLTLLQKTSNSEMTFFDHVKYALETVIKTLCRNANNAHPQSKDIIHLFLSSSTQPISSYSDNNQMHLLHQIKNLQCTIPTFPAEVIESALFHVGKFRCLNQTETFLGYRQGKIFAPALIFYITDNSNRRHIKKIYNKFVSNKLQLRSQYKFVTIKYCSVSPSQTNFNSIQKFKNYIEKQQETLLMEQLMKKMNGALYHAYQPDDLINVLQNQICKFSATLSMIIQNKQYKIYNKEIIKIQFPSIQNQTFYLDKLKPNQSQPSLLNSNKSNSLQFFIETIPLPRRTQIPLPFDITPKHLNQNNIIIDEFFQLKYYVDFTKQFVGQVDPLMKYLENIYQITDNCKLLTGITKDFHQFGHQKRFPLFFQKKKNQFLIGYLRLYYTLSASKSLKPCFQLHFSFSNFLNLNATIKFYKEHHPSSQQYFQNYISTLPIFYHKFLSHYLKNLNIVLQAQQNLFQNINVKPIGIINLRFFEQRLNQKRQLFLLEKINLQKHQGNQSQCCAVFQSGETFQDWERNRSQIYKKQSQFKQNIHIASNTLSSYYLKIQKILNTRKQIGIADYLNVQQVHSTSIKRQQQKYNIRREDDQMDQFVGDLLGNPFKKINKRVKANEQAQSLWMEQSQIKQMKQMLQKQKQIVKNINNLLPTSQSFDDKIQIISQTVFDKLTEVKEKIVQKVKKLQKSQIQEIPGQLNQKQSFISTEQISYNRREDQIQEQTLQNQSQKDYIQDQIIEAINFKNQKKSMQNLKENSKQFSEDTFLSTKNEIPQIIAYEINNKDQLTIANSFYFPSQLIVNDLYLRNRQIFQEYFKKNT